MGRTYEGIDVLTCVQGNTVRTVSAEDHNQDRCVVFDFPLEASSRIYTTGIYQYSGSAVDTSDQAYSIRSSNRIRSEEDLKKRRMRSRRKKAARARKVNAIRAVILAVFIAVVFIIGGIVSSAHMRRAPEAYKYYDTITVAYKENLLDIVLRYDNRDYYDTQFDYLEELCRINNIKYDGTSYPAVSPGTHLIVPYYSTELK